MGRGENGRSINDPRQLLFGPRRMHGAADPGKAIDAALLGLEQGHDGQAMVVLRRYQDKLGADEKLDHLMGQVIAGSVEDIFKDEQVKAVYHFRLTPDLAPMVLDDQVKSEEMDHITSRLSSSLRSQLSGPESKVELDSNEIVEAALSAPVIGSVANRLIGSMSQQQRIDWAYRLNGNKSGPAQFLENNIIYSLVSMTEADARKLSSDFAFHSDWSEKVTYFRRGGYGKPTTLHLLDETGRATLCNKPINRYTPRPIRRGCWRDAQQMSDYKRCAKCDKKMGDDFFGPAEDDENYSLLSRQQYDSVVRRSRRKVRSLFRETSTPNEEDLRRIAEELHKETMPMQRKAFAADLHNRFSESADYPLYLLRPLIGFTRATELASKLNWDWDNFKVPTARQFNSVLKAWPDSDAAQLQEPLAKLFFRTNGKQMPKPKE